MQHIQMLKIQPSLNEIEKKTGLGQIDQVSFKQMHFIVSRTSVRPTHNKIWEGCISLILDYEYDIMEDARVSRK